MLLGKQLASTNPVSNVLDELPSKSGSMTIGAESDYRKEGISYHKIHGNKYRISGSDLLIFRTGGGLYLVRAKERSQNGVVAMHIVFASS